MATTTIDLAGILEGAKVLADTFTKPGYITALKSRLAELELGPNGVGTVAYVAYIICSLVLHNNKEAKETIKAIQTPLSTLCEFPLIPDNIQYVDMQKARTILNLSGDKYDNVDKTYSEICTRMSGTFDDIKGALNEFEGTLLKVKTGAKKEDTIKATIANVRTAACAYLKQAITTTYNRDSGETTKSINILFKKIRTEHNSFADLVKGIINGSKDQESFNITKAMYDVSFTIGDDGTKHQLYETLFASNATKYTFNIPERFKPAINEVLGVQQPAIAGASEQLFDKMAENARINLVMRCIACLLMYSEIRNIDDIDCVYLTTDKLKPIIEYPAKCLYELQEIYDDLMGGVRIYVRVRGGETALEKQKLPVLHKSVTDPPKLIRNTPAEREHCHGIPAYLS